MREALLKLFFTDKTRMRTWRKLASLLRHNVQELQALNMLRNRAAAGNKSPILAKLLGGQPLAVILGQVIEALHKGQSLDVAFFKWIPHEETMLLRSGKRSAGLPEALLDCVDLIQSRQKIKSAVLRAVAYPIVLLGMFTALLLIISLHTIPAIAMMSDPETWTGAAALLYAISNFVASWMGAAALLILIGLGLAALCSLPYWTGPLRVKADNLPPWSVYRLLVGSVWIFTVVTLLRAKISLEYILSDSINSGVLRPWLKERVTRMRALYSQDANFGTLLLNLNMNFPDREMVEELAVYAAMPDFAVQMEDIAKEFLADGIERVEAASKALNAVLLMLIIAAMCGVGLAMGALTEQFQQVNSMGIM